MKTQKQIVKELITLQLDCLDKMDKFEEVGITLDFFGNFELLEKALDLVGFPPDNTFQYDLAAMNGEISEDKKIELGKLFCRDYLYDNSLFSGDAHIFATVDEYVDWLYLEVRRVYANEKLMVGAGHFKGISMN